MSKRLSANTIMKNPWLEHVDETISKNPSLKYKDVLKLAKLSYVRKEKGATKKGATKKMATKKMATKKMATKKSSNLVVLPSITDVEPK